MAEQDDNATHGVPATRSRDAPEHARGSSTPARDLRERRALTPEFLSLTYTLPNHLVGQVEDVADATNRSPSEVLADSVRLYLRLRKGMRRRARVSTVDGFAYQEVELSEAVLDEEMLNRLGSPERDALPAGGIGAHPAAVDGVVTPADLEESPEEAGEAPEATRNGADHAAESSPLPREQIVPAHVRSDGGPPGAVSGAVGGPSVATPTPAATGAETSPDTEEDGEPSAAGGTDARPERECVDDGAAATDPIHQESRVDGGTAESRHAPEESPPPPEAGADPETKPAGGGATDPGWEALGNVRHRSRPVESASQEETSAEAEPGGDELQLGPSGPAADEEAAADVRGRLVPLAGEPIDSQRLRRVLEAIMREVDRKDSSPPEHSRKVASLARRLAELRGLEGDALLIVELAGLVHDIGKACVPDDLIRHIRLTKEELAFVRRYPEMGAELLETVSSLEPVIPLVRAHQERWDGSGYPEGLERSEIPVGAQVVAICDIYDVLITERRYRPAYTEERAVQIIRQNIGTLWNPEIANVFIKKVL